MSIWMLQRVHHYEGWNGREIDVTIDDDYGYYTTQEAAEEACERRNAPLRAEMEKWNDRQREQHAKELGRRASAIAQNKVLEPAGLPLVPVPHVAANIYTKTWQGDWDDSIYWETVEIEEAEHEVEEVVVERSTSWNVEEAGDGG